MFKKIIRFLKKFNSLFIVIIAATVCAATIAAGIIYIKSMMNSLWTQIVSDVTEITAQGAHSFEIFLQKEMDSIETLTDNLSYFSYTSESDKNKVLDLFDMYSEEEGNFALAVYDQPEGAGKCTVYLALSNEEKYDAESAAERSVTLTPVSEFDQYGDEGISNVFYSMYTGEKSIAYYKRFTFKDGTEALVRKGQVLTNINKNFALSFYGDQGFSYITKSDGEIILRSDNINSNRTSKNIFGFLGTGEDSDKEIETLANAMAEGKKGAMLSTAAGDEKVLAFTPINHTDNWYAVSVIPNEAVAENVKSIIKSSLALTVIIAAVAILFTLFGIAMYFFRKNTLKQTAEVKHREQLFNILANNTNDVFIMLPHGVDTAEYISPNIERVMGVKKELALADLNAIGNPDNDEAEGEHHYGGLEALHKLEDGHTLTYDSARTHKVTGEVHYFHETVYRASIDGVDKDIVVFSDRTAEKLTEAQLTDAMEKANAASLAKSSFLSSMSHDIRTPMNAIVGMTSIATKHIDDKERVKDCLAKITMSSNHLLTLINDILDISKIESGKFSLSPVVFSLRDTVTNLVNIVRPQVTEKSLEFDIHINNVVYEYVFADVLRVNQIFINILSNAVKYTPNGGKVSMDLTQQVIEEGKAVRLIYVVKDTGIGMSEEYMKTMYDTFSRAQDTRTNTIQGTGLGLAIVKQMITLMNGTIECDSALNKGTTFTITLDLPVGEENKRELTLPPVEVLVIDDDEMFLDSVQDTLKELGATAKTATSGEQAIEIIKEHKDRFGVIIVDWRMPGMSGLETIKQLRKHINTTTPIILVSAYDWEDIENEAKICGVNGFISKPLFRSYIYEKLCELLCVTEKKEESSSDSNADLSGLKILVAEDNDLNWEVISVLLDMFGINCTRAKNGELCVETMESSPKGSFDLILMDVQMPVMNGKDATRAIRASKKEYVKKIPIIAMTADAFAEDIAACIDAGMDGHLSKPVDMDKLCQEIRRILFNKNGK